MSQMAANPWDTQKRGSLYSRLWKEYSKSKKFQEDFKNSDDFFDTPKIVTKESTPSTNSQAIVEEEDSINDIQDLLQYQEEHLPVPIKEKDNENFKILTMKKMKRKSIPPNKSVRKFAEDREPEYEKEFRISIKVNKTIFKTSIFNKHKWFFDFS